MLASLEEIVMDAARKDYAIPGFNVYGYEDAISVVRGAEELNAPAILMANKEAVDYMPIKYLANILCLIARDAKVPVCVHLDHAKDYEFIATAIKSGFTSVMYDGSQLPLSENIKNTLEVVKLAKACGVSVEAEIGSVGYSDTSISAKAIYTEPEEAKEFAEETGVDALAISIGTQHRMEVQTASIQYDRLEAIQKIVSVPLVIHGSTGVMDEDLAKLAAYHVAKVNIGTALRMEFGHTLRQEILGQPKEFDRLRLFQKPMEAVKNEVKKKYKILGFRK